MAARTGRIRVTGNRTLKHRLLVGATSIALALGLVPTQGFAQSAADLQMLREQIAELKAQQEASAVRIRQLESALAEVSARPSAAPVQTAAAAPAPSTTQPIPAATGQQVARADLAPSPAAAINPAGGSSPGQPPAAAPRRLAVNGDVRVRYEQNWGDQDARTRHRGVLRARLRANYAVNDWLSVGGQLVTGDPDDPNSSDITLGNFNDDLMVSLDQAFIRGTFGNLQVTAGKIPQTFVRTELVWDGDVSPQGVAATYRFDLGGGSTLRANGLYFLVDESVAGPNSDMIGGQLQFETAPGTPLRFELAAGYYDYQLRSLAGGDAGDFRTNRFLNGRYLSDFDLLDVIGAVTFNGFGERWPVRVVGDYVHNFGATTNQDTGFGVDLLVGRASRQHDWRVGYGYAQAGVDAVLTAFSHDNTDLASNYKQHTALIDYMLMPNVTLNGTFYRFKPKSTLFTPTFLPHDWVNRLRLNLLVNF